MVAERGTEMTEWNDGRLDDLSDRVDRIETKMDAGFVHIDQRFKETDQKMEAGFARLDKKMDEGFARMDTKFDEALARMDTKFDAFNERFDTMYQTVLRSSWALVAGILGLLGVLIGVVATQS